jgi:hypothetical protein
VFKLQFIPGGSSSTYTHYMSTLEVRNITVNQISCWYLLRDPCRIYQVLVVRLRIDAIISTLKGKKYHSQPNKLVVAAGTLQLIPSFSSYLHIYTRMSNLRRLEISYLTHNLIWGVYIGS